MFNVAREIISLGSTNFDTYKEEQRKHFMHCICRVILCKKSTPLKKKSVLTKIIARTCQNFFMGIEHKKYINQGRINREINSFGITFENIFKKLTENYLILQGTYTYNVLKTE